MPIIKLIFEVAMMRVVIIIKIVVAVLKPFIAVIKNVWNALAPLRRQLAIFIEIVKQVAEQVWNKLVKVFHGLWDFLVKKIVPIWDGLMKAMKPLVDFIKNAFVNSIKNLLNFLKPLWDFIKPMIDGIAKLLGIKIDIKAATKNVDMQEKKDKKDAAKEAAYKFSDSMFGGGLTGTGSKAGAGKVHKTTNIHTKVKVKTDAKPTEIAAQMVNAVKFNLPVLMAGGSGAMDAGMGSQLGGGYGGMGGSGIGAGA
jgi:hypothetical protein